MMKAFGRALSDFFVDGTIDLPPAEQKLREACRKSELCEFPFKTAEFPDDTDERTVRAGFVRFLLLGGCENAPVHESGIILKGAFISGLLDLDECEIKCSFTFECCTLASGICMTDASIKGFALYGCKVNNIPDEDAMKFLSLGKNVAVSAERMKSIGSIFVQNRCKICGEMRLGSSTISGYLYLDGNDFDKSQGRSIDLTGTRIGGDLYLGLPGDAPLLGEGLLPDVDSDARTSFEGRVILSKTVVLGDVFFGGAIIKAPSPSDSAALCCHGLNVLGGFDFRKVIHVDGVSLLGAKVSTLVDDLVSWKAGAKRHRFNGFIYDRIADESRSIDRRRWLSMQRPADLGKIREQKESGLRRQPWQQAAKALENGGDAEEAQNIRVALERRATASGGWRRLWAWPYDLFCRYGYSPWRLAGWIFLVWLIGAIVCDYAAINGQLVAADSKVVQSQDYIECDKSSGMVGDLISGYCRNLLDPDYSAFKPLVFSLDNLIPVIDLGQKKAWRLKTHASRFFSAAMTIEYLFGFIFGSALIATLGSFIVRKVT